MPATLAELMDAAGLAGPENELLKAQYIEALKRKNTPIVGATNSARGDTVVSPIGALGSMVQQILGGQGANSLMQAMSGNLRKKQDFETAGAQAAQEPGFDPGKAQYMFSAGGAPGLSGVANADENRQLKQALLAQQNAARQRQLETTGNFKLTSDMLKEQGLDRRAPKGQWNADKGGFTFDPVSQKLTTVPGDPAYAAAKNERASALAGAKDWDKAQSDLIKLSTDLDASLKARTAIGQAAQNVYRARAGTALIEGQMVPPQFAKDFAINLARIAGGGGNIGQEMTKELQMRSVNASLASIESYLTSRPVDVNMKEWIDLMIGKMKQEEQVAGQFITESNIKQVSRASRIAKHAPEDLRRLIKTHALDNHFEDDMLTPVAPAHLHGKVGKAEIAKDRARVPPGKRLIYDRNGKANAADADTPTPEGYWEPK